MFWMIVCIYIYSLHFIYVYKMCVNYGNKNTVALHLFQCKNASCMNALWTITNLDGDQDAIIPWNQIPHPALAQQNNHTSVLETRAEWYKHFHP